MQRQFMPFPAPAFDHPAFAAWWQDEVNDQKKPNPAKEQKKQVPHGDWHNSAVRFKEQEIMRLNGIFKRTNENKEEPMKYVKVCQSISQRVQVCQSTLCYVTVCQYVYVCADSFARDRTELTGRLEMTIF